MMRRLLLLSAALALAACTTSHPLPSDAGREPVIQCNDRWGSCTLAGYPGFDCCTDPATGDRYCCDGDHQVTLDDGTTTWMCGDGPACVDSWCCAVPAERYPDAIERCTHERFVCEGLWDYGINAPPGP